MESYENYSVSKWRVYCAERFKAAKFARDYFNENGEWPSLSQISQNSKLSPEEYEDIKKAEYAGRFSKESESMDSVSRPEINENTPEQEAAANDVLLKIAAGEKNITSESEINNLSIPRETTISPTIVAPLADGAVIKSDSPKYFTLTNTSEEPVSVTIESAAPVYLSGKFNDIYLNGKLAVASLRYPEINGKVTVDPAFDENVSISAIFGENSEIEYYNNKKLTVINQNENGSVAISAPNATVEVRGKYNVVEASASENTVVLGPTFHAKKLLVKKGNVLFYGIDINDFADEISIKEGTEVLPYTVELTTDNLTKMTSYAGVYNVAEDIEKQSSVAYGISASGKYGLNLNGHTLRFGNSRTGCIFLRGSATLNVNGEGTMENIAESYGIWVSSEKATANIYGGNFLAYTHVLYAEKGTINVYGGTFKALGNPELDSKGHVKFMLNCYDSSYTSGAAKINVYGGKFYNFNPAESYGEPGAPVSFVAEGYHVVESSEDGVPVFEVVAD